MQFYIKQIKFLFYFFIYNKKKKSLGNLRCCISCKYRSWLSTHFKYSMFSLTNDIYLKCNLNKIDTLEFQFIFFWLITQLQLRIIWLRIEHLASMFFFLNSIENTDCSASLVYYFVGLTFVYLNYLLMWALSAFIWKIFSQYCKKKFNGL